MWCHIDPWPIRAGIYVNVTLASGNYIGLPPSCRGAMFYLSCYRVGRSIGGVPLDSVEDCLDLEDRAVRTYGPITSRDFTATLFVADAFPRSPFWAPLLQSGFGADLGLPRSAAPGALLVIDIGKAKPDLFALRSVPRGATCCGRMPSSGDTDFAPH